MADVLEQLPSMCKEDVLRISGYLNLLCAEVMEHAKFDDARHMDGMLYQKVVSYISKNYMQDITLCSVAREFGYNVKYLSHTLHALTGIDFRKLVNFYRLNHAKGLLQKNSERNMVSVAEESGFGSLNTFNREFKSITGMTPSEYRKRFS